MNSAAGFFSYQGIASFPGATAACLLITRLMHQCFAHRFATVPEIAVAYAVAVILLVLATIALSPKFSIWDYIIIPINAVAVATTTCGGNILFGLVSPSPREEPVRARPIERVASQPSDAAP